MGRVFWESSVQSSNKEGRREREREKGHIISGKCLWLPARPVPKTGKSIIPERVCFLPNPFSCLQLESIVIKLELLREHGKLVKLVKIVYVVFIALVQNCYGLALKICGKWKTNRWRGTMETAGNKMQMESPMIGFIISSYSFYKEKFTLKGWQIFVICLKALTGYLI